MLVAVFVAWITTAVGLAVYLATLAALILMVVTTLDAALRHSPRIYGVLLLPATLVGIGHLPVLLASAAGAL